MSDRQRNFRYLVLDWIFSLLAWNLFYLFRYQELGAQTGFSSVQAYLFHGKALLLDVLIPCFWILLSALSGYYHQPRKKSIGGDVLHSLIICVLGSLAIFFTVIINDLPENYTQYYQLFIAIFVCQFLLMLLPRCLLTSAKNRQHLLGKSGIRTIVIGSGEKAHRLKNEYQRRLRSNDDLIVGYIALENENSQQNDSSHIPANEILGSMENLPDIIQKEKIEHIIIAGDFSKEEEQQKIIDKLYCHRLEMHLFSGSKQAFGKDISLSSVSGIPLVRLTPAGMQAWEMIMKRIFDIFISIFGLICLSPLLLFLMLRVKMDSKGPIFFTQERLGKDAKTFRIIKFRTMRTDAEAEGPQLSSANDSRITKFGAIMRRYRLDELPQLLNVIKGEMSLVGPRPERAYYAKQILQQAPHYELIYQVRPGITSLGMAKFGYANTVEKMIERLDYDIIYLKQASLLMDIKILVFTIKPVLSGSGL